MIEADLTTNIPPLFARLIDVSNFDRAYVTLGLVRRLVELEAISSVLGLSVEKVLVNFCREFNHALTDQELCVLAQELELKRLAEPQVIKLPRANHSGDFTAGGYYTVEGAAVETAKKTAKIFFVTDVQDYDIELKREIAELLSLRVRGPLRTAQVDETFQLLSSDSVAATHRVAPWGKLSQVFKYLDASEKKAKADYDDVIKARSSELVQALSDALPHNVINRRISESDGALLYGSATAKLDVFKASITTGVEMWTPGGSLVPEKVKNVCIMMPGTFSDSKYEAYVHELVECKIVDRLLAVNKAGDWYTASRIALLQSIGVTDLLTQISLVRFGQKLKLDDAEIADVCIQAFSSVQTLSRKEPVEFPGLDGDFGICESRTRKSVSRGVTHPSLFEALQSGISLYENAIRGYKSGTDKLSVVARKYFDWLIGTKENDAASTRSLLTGDINAREICFTFFDSLVERWTMSPGGTELLRLTDLERL